jgi:hypothetical protein
MPRSAVRVCLMAALAAASLSGCTASGPAYPPDPLFLSKKPIETAVENAASPAVPQQAPAVPAIPPAVLAALHREPAAGVALPDQALQPPAACPIRPVRRLAPAVQAADNPQ